jgi:hypothetical protein
MPRGGKRHRNKPHAAAAIWGLARIGSPRGEPLLAVNYNFSPLQ